MIDDAVRAAEAGGGDDFFVVDAFALVSGLDAMGGVALGRDRTEVFVVWHGISLPVGIHAAMPSMTDFSTFRAGSFGEIGLRSKKSII
jgi:hypothetical protein